MDGLNTYNFVVLIVVDGWGLSTAWGGNAIAINSPTFMNGLWRQYPHAILQIAEAGFESEMKMGNSEVGHASLAAGRILSDDFSDISEIIENGEFYHNVLLKKACAMANASRANLHLVGLLSQGGIHGHINHLIAAMELAKREGVKRLALHLISDGIDDSLTAGMEHVSRLQSVMKQNGLGEIVSLCGREYAMNTTEVWEDTLLAYRAQALGQAFVSDTALHALAVSYAKGYTDINIPPVTLSGAADSKNGKPYVPMTKDDVVVFCNFKGTGLRQLVRTYSDFVIFNKNKWSKVPFVNPHVFTLTDYQMPAEVEIVFRPVKITENLPEILSKAGMKQLRVAEGEKADNVTYFFNGGKKDRFTGEDDVIVESRKDKDWQNHPEMSADKVAEETIKGINSGKYKFILTNFANLDSVAHTGNFIATNQAVLKVDACLRKVVDAALKKGGAVIVTSDHGNAEQMIHREISANKMRHTANPVPAIFVTNDGKKDLLRSAMEAPSAVLSSIMTSKTTLADVAPTVLEMLGLPKPQVMTGNSLLSIVK